jgi:hypothetical protein
MSRASQAASRTRDAARAIRGKLFHAVGDGGNALVVAVAVPKPNGIAGPAEKLRHKLPNPPPELLFVPPHLIAAPRRPIHDPGMISRRALWTGIAIAVLLAIVVLFATPLSWFGFMAREELFPSTISWEGKSAWKRCESAIAGRTSWPEAPDAACRAMHLCANEAVLSEEQVDLLTQRIRETPGCQAP